MTEPRFRSRSKAIIKVKTPGAKVMKHYRHRKKSKPRCMVCGMPLHGISLSKDKSKAKSKKTVSRPFAGVLCHKCLKNKIIKEIVGGALNV